MHAADCSDSNCDCPSSSSTVPSADPVPNFNNEEFLRLVNAHSRRIRDDPSYRNSEEYKEFLKIFQSAILNMPAAGRLPEEEKEKVELSAKQRLSERVNSLRSQRNRKLSEKEIQDREDRKEQRRRGSRPPNKEDEEVAAESK